MQVLVKNWLVGAEKTEMAHLMGCSQCVAQISVLPGRKASKGYKAKPA